MASKVFDKLDAVAGVLETTGVSNKSPNPVDPPYVATPFINGLVSSGPGYFLFLWNLYAEDLGSSTTGCGVIGTIRHTFTVDYDNFPNAIPDSARIHKVTYRRPISINFSGMIDGYITGSLFNQINPMPANIFPINFNSIRVDSLINSEADIILFEVIAPDYMTKEGLIGIYSNFDYKYDVHATTGSIGSPPGDSSMGLTLGISEDWTITVEYTSAPMGWTISQPDNPPDVGDTITLTSPETAVLGLEPVDFTEVTAIDIVLPDGVTTIPVLSFTALSPNLLTFIVPDWAPDTPTVVQVVITSTQFSGSVEAWMWTIYFVSASGIYQLVPGKTSDTLYIEEQPGETIDVKIPNPLGKTGFF